MNALGKMTQLVGRVVDKLRAESMSQPVEHDYWMLREAVAKWKASLPADDPDAEFRAFLNGDRPTIWPEGWGPAEFGLTADSSLEEYQAAYQRELDKSNRSVRRALQSLERGK